MHHLRLLLLQREALINFRLWATKPLLNLLFAYTIADWQLKYFLCIQIMFQLVDRRQLKLQAGYYMPPHPPALVLSKKLTCISQSIITISYSKRMQVIS